MYLLHALHSFLHTNITFIEGAVAATNFTISWNLYDEYTRTLASTVDCCSVSISLQSITAVAFGRRTRNEAGKPQANDQHGSDLDIAIDVDQAVWFTSPCKNGGFGSKPSSESHTSLMYCCSVLVWLAGRLDLVDPNLLDSDSCPNLAD